MLRITKALVDKDGFIKVNKTCTYTPFNPVLKEHVEKIFNVNLEGRHWDISAREEEIEVQFFEDENIFGWLERISIVEFMKRLEANNLYLKLC